MNTPYLNREEMRFLIALAEHVDEGETIVQKELAETSGYGDQTLSRGRRKLKTRGYEHFFNLASDGRIVEVGPTDLTFEVYDVLKTLDALMHDVE